MKTIKWSNKKTLKVIQILFCIFYIAFLFLMNHHFTFPKNVTFGWMFFLGIVIFSVFVVIIVNLMDIFKSVEKEREEARNILKNKIEYHEKQLRHYQEEFNKLK
jgi:hypothetical protein